MQSFTLKSDITEDGKRMKLIFSGYLTLQNAREIKSALLGHDGDFKNIELMAKEVAGIDVSFLQILESFRQMNQEAGRTVKILMDLPYDIKTLLSNAGIAYPIK